MAANVQQYDENGNPIKAKKPIELAKIVEHDGPLTLPRGMKIPAAIEVLTREMEYRNETVMINAEIPGFLPDVLHAFFQALKQRFGWVHNKPTPGFFGPQPPTMVTVQTGLDTHVEVPWGGYVIPGVEGLLQTNVTEKDGRLVFVLGGKVKRRDEDTVLLIVEDTKKYLKEHSIFRGQAFRITFVDRNGEQKLVPEPTFLDINRNLKNELIFSKEVESAIQTSVLTPLIHTKKARAIGVPAKRGILLSGRYGTGKSMTSTVVADVATANGHTFILVERPDELAEILRLAREYAPAVVFCEDIDRVMSGGRTMDMDEVLNIVDGVESKNVELTIVLTTNHVETINQAWLRPGRLDHIIEVKAPDAEAAGRLVRQYGRGLIADTEDLTEVGRMLDGEIPAVIQEVVERSKLAAIYRDPEVELTSGAITSSDLVTAAHSMRNQLDLLAQRVPDERTPVEKAAQTVADSRIEAAKVHASTLVQELTAAEDRRWNDLFSDTGDEVEATAATLATASLDVLDDEDITGSPNAISFHSGDTSTKSGRVE